MNLFTHPALAVADSNNAVLYTFLVYMVGVFVIAWLSNRLLKSRSFLSEYFLGSRGLGVWAFALTLAATSSSGGSFMGFPSKIYTHGWSLGLWIGSYMVVPICVMGILGKRINEVARTANAITIPDVLRDRFRSVAFGLIAVSLIVFFMTFNLIAQFKGGSEILRTLLAPIDAFASAADALPGWLTGLSSLGGEYVLCLVVFGVAVIVYTTYGGFHAVVWTDVMQGIVMVIGVIIMLPLFGDYYTPNLLSGSPRTRMIGNEIDLFINSGVGGATGAALTVILMAFIASLMAYYLFTVMGAARETHQ